MKKLLFTALALIIGIQLSFAQSTGTPVSNKASGGTLTLGTSSLFNVNQTTAGQTITIPTPPGSIFTIEIGNVGLVPFTLSPGGSLDTGRFMRLRWVGTGSGSGSITNKWVYAGGGSISGGSITGVTAGTWLTGGGSSGNIPLNVDSSKVASNTDLSNGLALKVDKSGSKVLSDVNYTSAEQTKLAGIATGATVNSSDATLLARANHTGTQAATTVVEDATHRFFTDTERAKLTSVSSGATANSTDAQLRDRSTHTGTQANTTITGLGGASTLNVGTTAGTVAAGDDSRFTAINTNTQNALNLKANDASVVHNTGTETVAGVKTFSSSPIVPTSAAASNNTNAASNAYVDAAIGVTTPVGTIINETFSNLTNFTQTGTAFAVSGGVCNITGGSSFVFTDYIRQTQYGKSDLEKFTIEADYTIGTIGANTNGVGLGLKPAGVLNSTASITVAFLANTGNSGKIGFYFNAATTGAIISPGKLTLTAGDVTKIKVKMFKNTLFVTWIDVTTGQRTNAVYQYHQEATKPVVNSTVTSIIPNAFYYTVYALGGSHTLDNYKVTCDEFIQADYVFIGNSIDKGYNVDDINSRYVDIINNTTYSKAILIAGQSDCVEDWNAAEVIALQAKNIIVSVGGNNLILAESTAATMAKLATFISSLTSAGYVLGTNLYVCTARPRITYDMTSLNASIRSTYPTSFIELFYPYWAGSSFTLNPVFYSTDQTHPNTQGHKMEGLIYVDFFNIKQKYTYNLNNSYLFRDEAGFTGFGLGNNTPLYPGDFFSDVQSQIRGGITYSYSSRGGFSLTSTAASHVILMGGADYNSANGALFTARTTSASGVQCNAGDVSFYGNTGLTANTNYTLTGIGIMKSTGKWTVGSTTTPTAWLMLPATTTTAATASLKIPAGALMTTFEDGAIERDGTTGNLFFSNATARYTLTKSLLSTATLDFPSTTTISFQDLTATVTGAAVGDEVVIGSTSTVTPTGILYAGKVSATNTITVSLFNFTGSSYDPASAAFNITVIKH